MFSETYTLGWCYSQFGFFFPVAQATSRQDYEHHHQHPKAEQKAVAYLRRGEKGAQGNTKGVDGCMHQYGHKHATFGVVENPRGNDGKGDGYDDELDDVQEATATR